jgi:catechol 2,3-dioxygenase-like lactoylglutathione lyase family enzyme
MAITGTHHCSFTVTDIKRTVEFYTRVLGLELIKRFVNEGGDLGTSLGLNVPKAKLDIAFMKAGDTQIEFIEYVEPKARPCPQDPSIAGSGHIAFKVDDIYATKQKIEEAGIKFNTDVNVIEKGELKGWKWCYFRDFDGITMEIVQEK